jgi:Tfp pilus assembly protein PilZ
MVTTEGREQDLLHCQNAGCDDYITKPIIGKTFIEKGRNCIADFDRRRRRFTYSIDVQFLKDGEPRYGVTADISKGGLFIAVPNDGIPDDPVDLQFSLPHEGKDILVAARGRVAWENRHGDLKKPNYPAGVGIQFTDIDPSMILLIEQFFEEALPVKS